jgi:hypothetical protein
MAETVLKEETLAGYHVNDKPYLDTEWMNRNKLRQHLRRKLEKHGFGDHETSRYHYFVPIEDQGPEEIDRAMEKLATTITKNFNSVQAIDVGFKIVPPGAHFLGATVYIMSGDLKSFDGTDDDSDYESEDDVTKELVRAVKARGVSCGRLERCEFFVGDDTTEVTAIDEAARLISESEDRVEHIDTTWLKKDDVLKELKVVVFTRM